MAKVETKTETGAAVEKEIETNTPQTTAGATITQVVISTEDIAKLLAPKATGFTNEPIPTLDHAPDGGRFLSGTDEDALLIDSDGRIVK